jgi:hypothetical protein
MISTISAIKRLFCKTNVSSCISWCPPKRLSCTDKHWLEMTVRERIQAGPFLCIIKPDAFDNRFGKFVEFMILYEQYEEYVNLKKFAIESGRLEECLC